MNTDYSMLIEVLNTKEELKNIKLTGTKLSYNNETIDLKDLNFEYFLNNNPKFKQDLPSLTPEAIFNIIKLHLKYVQVENEKEEQKAKEYIDTTPLLRPFSIVKRNDSEKIEHSYIHYKDSNGINHVLENAGYKELFEAYKAIIQSDSIIKTDKEIFELLKLSYKEIIMEDLYSAEQRVDAKEQHINNLRKLEEDNSRAMELNIETIGNEENNIYINNGNIITIDEDIEGKTIEQKHDTETKENESLDSITIQDETKLIDFNEYVSIIMNKEFLSDDEKDKIKAYESFLFDIITYKDYLTPELYNIYKRWSDLYQKLYYAPVMTDNIKNTLNNYAKMQERSSQVKIINAREEVMKLERKNPDNKSTGFVGATIYIILTIALGILIASLLFIAL